MGMGKNVLGRAYFQVHNEYPWGLEQWQMAERIVEVLDDPTWIPKDLARECVQLIVNMIMYPDRATRERIVYAAEEASRKVFPELVGIDEVHMDQVQYVYDRWTAEREIAEMSQ